MTTILATSLCSKFVIETDGNHHYYTVNVSGRKYRQFAGRTIASALCSLAARSSMGY
jgi:hypothetical protein